MSSPAPSPRPAGRDDDDVDLTDLEIIRRYSLAVRQGSAGRAEVLAALRSDLARLEPARAVARSPRPSPRTAKPAARRTATQAPARRTTRG